MYVCMYIFSASCCIADVASGISLSEGTEFSRKFTKCHDIVVFFSGGIQKIGANNENIDK